MKAYRYKVRLVKEVAPEPFGVQVLRPSDGADVVRRLIGFEAVEVALVLLLDRRHRLRGYHEVGRGGVAHASMEPREVLRVALLSGSAALMVAHNHPSGEATPSADDLGLTRRMARACDLLGIEFVDHLIVGEAGQWCSLVEQGAL